MLQNSLLRYSRLLFYFGCLWCSVLVVDYTMPEELLVETVMTDINAPKSYIHKAKDLLATAEGHSFNIPGSEMRYFPVNTKLTIYRSPLLSAIIRVENHNHTFVINNLGTIYRNLSFAPIILLLGCVIGLFIKKGVEFHVNLGIVVFLLMILNIVLLYASRI
jgi:hypothetical protein